MISLSAKAATGIGRGQLKSATYVQNSQCVLYNTVQHCLPIVALAIGKRYSRRRKKLLQTICFDNANRSIVATNQFERSIVVVIAVLSACQVNRYLFWVINLVNIDFN